MKDVARDMWLPKGADLGPDSHPGRLFLEELAAFQRERSGFLVDLVDHSAGSIAICHLLEADAADEIGVRIRNVVFLAPAVHTDLFHRTLLAEPGRFEHLRMLTMQDARQREDVLVKLVYTRSLLFERVVDALGGQEPWMMSGMSGFTVGRPLDGLRRHLDQF